MTWSNREFVCDVSDRIRLDQTCASHTLPLEPDNENKSSL